MKPAITVLLAIGLFCVTESAADARWNSRARSGVRPVSGYGANIHRNFVLKQELRRAANGGTVRNRGNIRWYRPTHRAYYRPFTY